MRSLDPALPLEIKTWNSELDSALFAARVATVSLGVLGLLGAMLAITGIFGMASYTVSKRLRELGIRIALGANQRKVLGAALGRAFRLLAIGSAAGMILGVLATRVLSSSSTRPRQRTRSFSAASSLPCWVWARCCMDPRPTRPRCRSDDPAARGMSWVKRVISHLKYRQFTYSTSGSVAVGLSSSALRLQADHGHPGSKCRPETSQDNVRLGNPTSLTLSIFN